MPHDWCLCLSCPCISLQSKRQNKREHGNKREKQKRAFSSWDPSTLHAFRLRPLRPLRRLLPITPCAGGTRHRRRPSPALRARKPARPPPKRFHALRSARRPSQPSVVDPPHIKAHRSRRHASLCNLPLHAGKNKMGRACRPVAKLPKKLGCAPNETRIQN